MTEFRTTLTGLIDRLADRLPEVDRRDIREFDDVGEEGLALDLMAAVLMKNSIPITREQWDILHTLLYHFELPTGESYIDRRDEVMAALNVVEDQ